MTPPVVMGTIAPVIVGGAIIPRTMTATLTIRMTEDMT